LIKQNNFIPSHPPSGAAAQHGPWCLQSWGF